MFLIVFLLSKFLCLWKCWNGSVWCSGILSCSFKLSQTCKLSPVLDVCPVPKYVSCMKTPTGLRFFSFTIVLERYSLVNRVSSGCRSTKITSKRRTSLVWRNFYKDAFRECAVSVVILLIWLSFASERERNSGLFLTLLLMTTWYKSEYFSASPRSINKVLRERRSG